MAKGAESRRAYLSVSRGLFDKLKKASERTGAPIGILVELAVSAEIDAPLSKQAQQWATKLAARG